MKSILIMAIALGFSTAHAAQKVSMCQAVAEKAATDYMDKIDSQGLTDDEGKPRELTEDEKAGIGDVYFLDENDEPSDSETGIYGITMGVMEECMDGLKVTTKKSIKDGKESCEVIDIQNYGDRDCG